MAQSVNGGPLGYNSNAQSVAAASDVYASAVKLDRNYFDYKKYSSHEYSYEGLIRLYFETLQPNFKQSLASLGAVTEDDLGPEIILNLKWLDAYRYSPNSVYLYLDLLQ